MDVWKGGVPVGSYKRGHWAVAPTRGHIAKAWVSTCPLKLQCPLVQVDTLPQKKGSWRGSASRGKFSLWSLGT